MSTHTADHDPACTSMRKLALLAILLPLAAPAYALDISARGNAMGGVMDLDARGAESVSSCPAGLANSTASLAGGWAFDGTNDVMIIPQLMSFVSNKPGESAAIDHIYTHGRDHEWNAEVRSLAGCAASWDTVSPEPPSRQLQQVSRHTLPQTAWTAPRHSRIAHIPQGNPP